MSIFKSFDPPKFSKHSIYKKNGKFYNFSSSGIAHKTLCSNCGYSYGNHFSIEAVCPTKIQVFPSSIKPVKH